MTTLKLFGGALALSLLAQPALANQPQIPRGEILGESIKIGTVPRIVAKVNGLVCDFCAQSLKKTFSKEAAVNYIDVDLKTGTVQITLKSGQDISDARVAELIRKSGYSLVSSTREGGA